MNRKHEYEAMMKELDLSVPALDSTLERAYNKKRKRTAKLIARPFTALAACFALFVALVNFSAPVAQACSQIPILRDLADAVTFSRSLTAAVENAYAQPMQLSQTENGITAEIAYLIVDQKQVNVFYRFESKQYKKLNADPFVKQADGDRPPSCAWGSSNFNEENDELRCLSIDFVEGTVPDRLIVQLKVFSYETVPTQVAPERAVGDSFMNEPGDDPAYLAEFEFLLEFDPTFTATGKIFPVNKTVLLEGQEITITNVEVYPTHMRVEIAESQNNSAWLQKLDFYVEADSGMKFEPVSSGITATGSANSPSMVSYRADSSYFYDAKNLKLVITGARWLRKDMQTTYLNLVTGEHGELPEGAVFDSARQEGTGWVVKFRAALEEDGPMYQLFGHKFYDADGNEYEINRWSSIYGDEDENGNITYFYDEFPLRNYPYDEVWLTPHYSHNWIAENQIIVTIQ